MGTDGNIIFIQRPIQGGQAALFLDRDGVINRDTGYVQCVDSVELLPGVAKMISSFNAAGWPVIVVSNQSGIGRGYFTRATAVQIQDRVEELLAEDDAAIDAVFLCGVHPEHSDDLSFWRKPKPGMLQEAGRLFDIDLGRSILLGDKLSDLQAADRAGLRGAVLVDLSKGSAASSDTHMHREVLSIPILIVNDLDSIRPDRLNWI